MKAFASTRSFGAADPAPVELLRSKGVTLEVNPTGRKLTPEESAKFLQGVDGLLAGVERLDDAVFSSAPGLKVVSRVGTGLDNVDLDAAKRRGIQVFNTPDAPVVAVAELAVALLLSVFRRVPALDAAVRQGRWEAGLGRQLSGRTVGLVGFGRIGRAVAGLLKGFSCRVLVHDPAAGAESVALDELLRQSDAVSLHLALTDETRGIIDRRRLALMPRGAVFVNTSRGGLVDEAALADALASGALSGAALDVFEKEPYSGPLTGRPEAVLTPHVGSATAECRAAMEMEAARNLLKGLGLSGGAS